MNISEPPAMTFHAMHCQDRAYQNDCAAEGLACMVRMHASPVRLTLLLVALARTPSSSTYSTSASGVVTEMPIPARFASTCSGQKQYCL